MSEWQLYFWTLAAPASREACEIVAFSGMLRIRDGNLPARHQIQEISINLSSDMVGILAAWSAYAQFSGSVKPGQPDALPALAIWDFGIETVGLRSTLRADVQLASDRALKLLAREHGHGDAPSEFEDVEIVMLLSGPAAS